MSAPRPTASCPFSPVLRVVIGLISFQKTRLLVSSRRERIRRERWIPRAGYRFGKGSAGRGRTSDPKVLVGLPVLAGAQPRSGLHDHVCGGVQRQPGALL